MLNDTRTAASSPAAASARDGTRTPCAFPPVAGVPLKRRGGRAPIYVWTDDKVATLLAMREEGKRNYEIARAIGFPEQAVKLKVTELRCAGVSIPAFKSGPLAGERYPAFRPPQEPSETKRQAEGRAKRLEQAWWARGYPQARFWVIKDRDDDREIYCVRSNLVNGMPVVRRVKCVT